MEKHNAKLNRNVIRWLVAFAALGGFQVAQAGYAQLANPAGFGGTSGAYTYAANAANDKTIGRVVQSAGSLTANVGGQTVKMGAAYRLAANAPRIAAAVVFMHPAVRIAAGVATWIGLAGFAYNVATNQWGRYEEGVPVNGWVYAYSSNGPWYVSPSAALAAYLKTQSTTNYTYSPGTCNTQGSACTYSVITKTTGESRLMTLNLSSRKTAEAIPSTFQPVTQPEFEDGLIAKPMPSTVPLELPQPTPLPIELPSPWINPTPGENPQSQPYRVPTGQPSPVPNTNPQQYSQPYIDIIPAPTTDNPFRVDIKPGEVISTDPNPVTNPTDPTAEDKPTEEKDKDLCEKYPDILACAKPELDTPDGEIPKSSKTITYQTEDTFGGGSCPADIYANIHGKSTKVYEWSRTCNVVTTYLRPIILLLGAMGALFILIPGRDS